MIFQYHLQAINLSINESNLHNNIENIKKSGNVNKTVIYVVKTNAVVISTR